MEELPGLVGRATERFELRDVDPGCSVGWSFVARARRGNEPVILKLVISDEELQEGLDLVDRALSIADPYVTGD